jgi:quercetin dioxygenase-like cupin family protein
LTGRAGGTTIAPSMPDATPLPTDRHALYSLGPDLLLVFKPRGHRETVHAHPHPQRLRVLRGALVVERGARIDLLAPDDAALAIAAGESHATEARADTWLVVDSAHRER